MLVRQVPGHPHRMTFGNIKFHLLIGLLLGKAVQVILKKLAILGVFYIPIKHTIVLRPNREGIQTGPGLVQRLDHPTQRFERAQRAMR